MSKSEQYTPVQANIFRRHPVVNRPPKRHTDARRGQEFTPHGTDSVGVIVSDPQRSRKTIQFRYRHDPETLHAMQAHEFNDRFCGLGAKPGRTVKVALKVDTKAFAAAIHAAATKAAGRGPVTERDREQMLAEVRSFISAETVAA